MSKKQPQTGHVMTEIYSNFLTYFTVIKAVFVIALILMTVNVTHNALYMMAPVVKDGNDAPPHPRRPPLRWNHSNYLCAFKGPRGS